MFTKFALIAGLIGLAHAGGLDSGLALVGRGSALGYSANLGYGGTGYAGLAALGGTGYAGLGAGALSYGSYGAGLGYGGIGYGSNQGHAGYGAGLGIATSYQHRVDHIPVQSAYGTYGAGYGGYAGTYGAGAYGANYSW